MNQEPPGPFKPPPPADPPGFSGPFVPLGMPPGTDYVAEGERAPDAVPYFRIYAGITAVFYGLITLFGLVTMISPFLMTRLRAPDLELGTFVAGMFYAAWGALFCVPTLLTLFGGRKSWVHPIGTVLIAVGMIWVCCLPVLIPLLVLWTKPEVRRYFDA